MKGRGEAVFGSALKLADPLAAQAELGGDVRELVGFAAVDPVAADDDRPFGVREGGDPLKRCAKGLRTGDGAVRRRIGRGVASCYRVRQPALGSQHVREAFRATGSTGHVPTRASARG